MRRLAFIVALLSLLTFPTSVAVYAQTPGTLDVTQDSVCDGGWVEITGSSWPANGYVHLKFDGTSLVGATTNASGVITGINGTPGVWRQLPGGRIPTTTYTVAGYVPQNPAVEDIVHALVTIDDAC